MNGHDRNMLWQANRSHSPSQVFLLGAILLTIIDMVSPTASCIENNCSKTLHKGVKLARFMKRTTGELTKTYQANQGDFAKQFCKMSMDNVPDSTLSGHTQSDRVLSIFTRLKEFLPHMIKVAEQQKDLQPSSSTLPLLISDAKEHIVHLAHRVHCIFQMLQPNIPVPEPPVRPTRISPAQNVFQQKVYGCLVLTRLSEFLFTTVNELRSLKVNKCNKRTRMI